ncbi:uncharacterized protein PV09_04148 [Verruconis gallopava]|uniref:Zn(2)-C6 fungal-type domain-containing protein n=1 Tax=Verruconis gallopava TaxID=253628 RepID=A0A0D2ADG3_9PEZI|nr:uncharacterized protein PV09_04148 [Verruconis gallopava]KIW04988.1 hypothetical protein PV09_04148 [Verruconis gallopava]
MTTNTDRDIDEHSEIEEDEVVQNASSNRRRKTKDANHDDGPACHSCRKKKAKCSRTQPCTQCQRYNVGCVYEEKKARPGFKTGAIEALNRRLDALEKMFLGQGVLWEQVLKSLNGGPKHVDLPTPSTGSLQEYSHHIQQYFSSLAVRNDQDDHDLEQLRPAKRQRTHDDHVLLQAGDAELEFKNAGEQATLPPDDLMDSLIEIYFTKIHPWIPMLHIRNFREALTDPVLRKKKSTILHAITSLCIRFSDDARLRDSGLRSAYAQRSRQIVILRSMESFSMENLQAMIICAFDIIGSGRGPSAWSIIGSMTRTVEHLQLSVEDEELPEPKPCLIRRLAFLPRPTCWTEVEDRRRVFWNIFLMDRFCSITTGWNLSLTSADVRRRLPCEGALWEKGQPLEVPTPYFGVSDQSRNSGSTLPMARPEDDDQVSLGGFAYCIEATESLSLVTSFFLQQAVDMTKMNDVQLWLMRFKELDLRLIRWKIFLPSRWQQACALNADGIMDPNLTLAHITHNTAVVLLHQGIAYPPAEWEKVSMRLPSASSAETCLAAATEVSIIAEKFLQGSPILTNPQFAFCLFVSGRVLLVHASYYNIQLSSAFQSIVDSLWEIGRRWNGLAGALDTDNLASKFASRLLQAKQQGSYFGDIRHAAYAQDSDQEGSGRVQADSASLIGSDAPCQQSTKFLAQRTNGTSMETTFLEGNVMPSDGQDSPDSISMAFPPLPLAFQGGMTLQEPNVAEGKRPAQTAIQHPPSAGLDTPSLEFGNLNQYFDYDYMSSQRISMFSQGGHE